MATTLSGLANAIYGAGTAPKCVADPDLFFGSDSFVDEPEHQRVRRVEKARALCAVCPVRLACGAYAMRIRPTAGVWAGHDADAGELDYLATAEQVPAEVSQKPAA